MIDDETKSLVRKFVLKNALEHDGKARSDTVIAKIIGLKPELRKEVRMILDEINVVMDKGLIPIKDILDLMEDHGNVELYLTGRDAPQEILDKADYVNIIKGVKHPWQKGIKARKGIEY